ncbi:MAG TPA: acetylxylan esterase [Clostridiales bacterium]|nr:acetylxylan esterase [Clostridiales bacterium]
MRSTLSKQNDRILANTTPALAFDPALPIEPQKNAAAKAFSDLLRMPEKATSPVPIIEYQKDHEIYKEIRFTFESEPGFMVPAHLLLPKNHNGTLPVVICLQGHSTGMHISLGRPKFEGDEETIAGDRDFALQAVARGYAAVAMEQRGFGELKSEITGGCTHPAMQALLLGRTLLGERIFDVSRLIDTLAAFSFLDLDRIGIMGNSGGGTTSYHAACVEPRIGFVMPSCSFNTYGASIFSIRHCCCNYIPDILQIVNSFFIANSPFV